MSKKIQLPKAKLTAARYAVFPDDAALQPAPKREAFPSGEEGDKEHQAACDAYDAAWTEYARTHDGRKLPTLPGCQPVIFVIRPLDAKQVRHVENLRHRFGDMVFEELAYGVMDVLNLRDSDGAEVKVERDPSDLGPRLPAPVLAIFHDEELRQAIWYQVRQANTLPSEVAKSH